MLTLTEREAVDVFVTHAYEFIKVCADWTKTINDIKRANRTYTDALITVRRIAPTQNDAFSALYELTRVFYNSRMDGRN